MFYGITTLHFASHAAHIQFLNFFSCFCSGQTGSGKTFTMLGENLVHNLHCVQYIPLNDGIIEMALFFSLARAI